MNLFCIEHSHRETAKQPWFSLKDTGLSNVVVALQVLHCELQVYLNLHTGSRLLTGYMKLWLC